MTEEGEDKKRTEAEIRLQEHVILNDCSYAINTAKVWKGIKVMYKYTII